MLIAHVGQPIAPHDLWSAWSTDPVVAVSLPALFWLHRRGTAAEPGSGLRRTQLFRSGLIVVGLALLSPLDAVSGALASAHMVQHLLLFAVAAPLLAFSRPLAPLSRGLPPSLRSLLPGFRRRVGLDMDTVRLARAPAPAWLAAVATLWLWHARFFYELALANRLVHALEHTAFLISGLAVWSVIANAGRARRTSPGIAILMLFTLGLTSTLLAALMTFSPVPWYDAYARSTEPWGLSPLGDQQLAGLIMWFPVGILYVGAALVLLMRWLDPEPSRIDRAIRDRQNETQNETQIERPNERQNERRGVHHGPENV